MNWTYPIFTLLFFFTIACNNDKNRSNVIEAGNACNGMPGNTLVSFFLYSQESITIALNGEIAFCIKNQSDSIEYFDQYFNFKNQTKKIKIHFLNMIDTFKVLDTTFVLTSNDKDAQYSIQSRLPVFLSLCADSSHKFYDAHKLNMYNSYRHFIIAERHYSIDDDYSLSDFEIKWTQCGNHIEIDQWKNYCIEPLPYEKEIIKIDYVIPRKEW